MLGGGRDNDLKETAGHGRILLGLWFHRAIDRDAEDAEDANAVDAEKTADRQFSACSAFVISVICVPFDGGPTPSCTQRRWAAVCSVFQSDARRAITLLVTEISGAE